MTSQPPRILRSIICLLLVPLFLFSCKPDLPVPGTMIYKENRFPDEIANILVNRCTNAGCHNNISKEAASGLSLTGWDNLFKGNRGGAVVVPFRPDHSSLLFSVNSFPELGPQTNPLMPFQLPSLSYEEVSMLREWVEKGAPDKNGMVKFSDDPDRRKLYVTNQGCDQVAVFDAATGLAMRYVDVGVSPSPESPHMVRVSPDRKYWYVVFSVNGTVLQKFSCADDTPAGVLNLGSTGSWNTMAISSDSKRAFVVDWSSGGTIVYVDLETMSILKTMKGGLTWTHGVAFASSSIIYVTSQPGNYLYKIDFSDLVFPDVNSVSLLKKGEPAANLSPHEIQFSPDGKKYFVSCQGSDEVRVMDAVKDTVLEIIPVGNFPSEFALSAQTGLLFVTCSEDTVSFPGYRGSVAVINYFTNKVVKKIYSGFQPHGIALDETGNRVYVVHRNISPTGPAPHHSSVCGGRNGYVTAIDLNTLELVPGYKHEAAADPYSAAVR